MAAIQDKSVPARFHFGNALIDLDHVIPRGDEVDFMPFETSTKHSADLSKKLDGIELQLGLLLEAQSKLSFALRDIKRSIK